jgi:hypothetical protein
MGFLSDLFSPKPPAESGRKPVARAETKRPGYLQPRSFTAPATPHEVMAVLFAAFTSMHDEQQWKRLKEAYDERVEAGASPSDAPLVETVYISHLDESGLTVSAGNRVKTYWTIELSFAGENPTSGRMEVFPQETMGNTEHVKWMGNIMSLETDLRFAVESIGGEATPWPM